VEEDNWARYSATENPTQNIQEIPQLQKLFDQYGVKPTYLVTYPVVNDPHSVKVLKSIVDEGKCEIGMHCHPWNTPPYNKQAVIREEDTMLCNLADSVVFEKLSHLHTAICQRFGVTPVSFRAGRWGFSASTAQALRQLKYRVDSSVCPYIDWTCYHGPNYTEFTPALFRFNDDIWRENGDIGDLLEIPASIGFLQKSFSICQKMMEMAETRIVRRAHLKGIMDRLRLINKRWLSPEITSLDSMISLARRFEKNGYPCINMTFHSTSLLYQFSSIVQRKQDQHAFFHKIQRFLAEANKNGWISRTLSEFEHSYSSLTTITSANPFPEESQKRLF